MKACFQCSVGADCVRCPVCDQEAEYKLENANRARLERIAKDVGLGPQHVVNRYGTVKEIMSEFGFYESPFDKVLYDKYIDPTNDPFYKQMQQMAAQVNIGAGGPIIVPGGSIKAIPKYSGGRSNTQALALALANNWDVVVPKDDELFIDIDSTDQYMLYSRAITAFDQNICPVRDVVAQPSKSGDPARKHIYIRLDMASYHHNGYGSKLTDERRITFQSMLCSDAVREMLSWSRFYAGDLYPTLFFEKPGATPKGFGTIIQAGNTTNVPVNVALPSASPSGPLPTQRAVIVSQPKISAPTGYFIGGKAASPQPSSPPDPARYPHTCPKCGGPSYNGLMSFDCMKGCKP